MPEGFFSDNMDASFTEYSCADDYINAISTIEPELSVIDNISSNIVPLIEIILTFNFIFTWHLCLL